MNRNAYVTMTIYVVAGWITSLWSQSVCADDSLYALPTVEEAQTIEPGPVAAPPLIEMPVEGVMPPDLPAEPAIELPPNFELAPRPDLPRDEAAPVAVSSPSSEDVPMTDQGSAGDTSQESNGIVGPGEESMVEAGAMIDSKPATDPNVNQDRGRWWESTVGDPLLDSPEWVSFDLQTIMLDALAHNPRIAAVTHEASVAMEQIVRQDAVFDPSLLLSSKLGSTNDPVGNTLTTGGPKRLIEDSWNHRAGMVKTNRDGTRVDLSQQLGYLDSNSLFFKPHDQGNAKLTLSVTKPLRNGAGETYNQRLVIQARIDAKLTNQQMREEVQERVARTMITYWQLYQVRCQWLQVKGLLERGSEIQNMIEARRDFDVGDLEMSKVNTRMVRRRDQLIKKELELRNLQTQLIALVASNSLQGNEAPLELIPIGAPLVAEMKFDLKDAVVEALNNRMDVRSAALDMESASLELAISRNELLPQLNAIAGGYLAGLNGQSEMFRSFGDQFSLARPGVNAGLEYEVPYGRRAAHARNRAAHQMFMQMTERYRETVVQTRAEVEIATRNLQTAWTSLQVKTQVYNEALRQETLVRERWETMGPDGRGSALVLEDLLDQQDSRALAEQDLVAGEVAYLTAMIDLQQAMGTLLTSEGISPDFGPGAHVDWKSQGRPDQAPYTVGPLPEVPRLDTDDALIESDVTP